MADQRTPFLRRRVVALGLVALVIAAAVALFLVLRSGPAPEAGEQRIGVAAGIEITVPSKGWKERIEAPDAIEIRSKDGAVALNIASAGPAEETDKALEDTVALILEEYKGAAVEGTEDRPIADIDGRAVAIGTKQDDLRILVAAGAGEENAYLLTVLTGAGASAETLEQTQRMIDSLALTK